jgi:16S rRNA (guanine527-N7)-methyltransferase
MFRELLASEWSRPLSSVQLDLLERHYELLRRWNRSLNLTRIERLEDMIRLHFCESLFLGTVLPSGPLRIGDVGSGAGFPGIPMAILRPECSLSLVESHQRKAVFLREACSGISNASVLAQRAESVSERYDWVVSRAVRPDQVLSLDLAGSSAILMTAGDLQGLPKPAKVVTVPWGDHRIVGMFHVEHSAC